MKIDMKPFVQIQNQIEKAETDFQKAVATYQTQTATYEKEKKDLWDLYDKRKTWLKEALGEQLC